MSKPFSIYSRSSARVASSSLTYCISKKWGNHACAMVLHFAHFNFCRKHRGIKGKSPAMAAGLTGHAWTVRELLESIG